MSKGTTRTKKRYLRGAADLWREAVRLQQRRLETDSMDTRIDLNFYTVAVFRLCNIARQAINLSGSERLRGVLDAFYARWPDFKLLRNEQEHFIGPQGRQVHTQQRPSLRPPG